MMNIAHYTMLIQWSDEDQVFLVSLPEWETQAGLHGHAHGATYAEAVRSGEELLDLLMEGRGADGLPLPVPQLFAVARA